MTPMMATSHDATAAGSPSAPLVLGLAGPAGCGKSTAAALLAARGGWRRLSFADPLRELLLALHPAWDLWHLGPGKDLTPADGGPSPRELMRSVGDWAKRYDQGFFVRIAHQALQRAQRQGLAVVIDDVRYEPEATLIRSLGGRIVHLSRPEVRFRRDHTSELGIEPSPEDLHLRNWGGLSALSAELEQVLGLAGLAMLSPCPMGGMPPPVAALRHAGQPG